MQKKRVAVLIHGCHLHADLNGASWEDIVWGGRKLTTLDGRAAMGIKVAIDNGAEFVIFSTGASEIEGVKEGEYTYRAALLRTEQLASAIGSTEEKVRSFLRERSRLDLESQNTRSECETNFATCAAAGIDRVYIVSSPWHIQRCLTEALKVAEAMRSRGEQVPEVVAVASHGSPEGIVVLEPSHRGDQPKNRFAALGARFFRVVPGALESFQRDIEAVLRRYSV